MQAYDLIQSYTDEEIDSSAFRPPQDVIAEAIRIAMMMGARVEEEKRSVVGAKEEAMVVQLVSDIEDIMPPGDKCQCGEILEIPMQREVGIDDNVVQPLHPGMLECGNDSFGGFQPHLLRKEVFGPAFLPILEAWVKYRSGDHVEFFEANVKDVVMLDRYFHPVDTMLASRMFKPLRWHDNGVSCSSLWCPFAEMCIVRFGRIFLRSRLGIRLVHTFLSSCIKGRKGMLNPELYKLMQVSECLV
jgi:hypothetical protein